MSIVDLVFCALMMGSPEGEWTQWGGPNGNFKVSTPGLPNAWPEDGPPLLWQRPLGAGYSAILAEAGKLYTMYRDGEADVVIALDADTGETLWTFRYDAPIREGQRDSFGQGPNAPPHLLGNRLYTMSFNATLHCLDKHTGDLIWKHNLVEELDGKVHISGNSNAMVTHDGMLITMVGGEHHAMVGFDLASGKVVWKSEPAEVSYGAPTLISVGEERQWAFLSKREVIGIAVATGKIRWRHPQVNQHDTHAARPIMGQDGLLFVPSQRDGGSLTLRLRLKGSEITVEEVMRTRNFNVLHGNVVRSGEIAYGSNGNILTALNVRTGKVLWRERGFPVAQLIAVDDKFLILDESGKLTLAFMTAKGFNRLAQHEFLKPRAWTVPTLAGTRLFMRDTEKVMAVDLAAEDP